MTDEQQTRHHEARHVGKQERKKADRMGWHAAARVRQMHRTDACMSEPEPDRPGVCFALGAARVPGVFGRGSVAA